MKPLTIATIRGAGLSFPVACLIYVFSGQIAVFTLILVGALLGFGTGFFLSRIRLSDQKTSAVLSLNKPFFERISAGLRFLTHPNLFVRFSSLLTLGIVLFVLAWSIGYYLLPEGAFRAGADAMIAARNLEGTSTSILQEWARIFRANSIPAILILAGSLLIKVNGFPFGFLVAFYNIVGYGLFVGTNSFGIPYPERMAPSLAILARSGPYEMLALLLLAASTCCWSLFEVKRIFMTNPEKVSPRPRISVIEVVGVMTGVVVLMAANWREAAMVVASFAR